MYLTNNVFGFESVFFGFVSAVVTLQTEMEVEIFTHITKALLQKDLLEYYLLNTFESFFTLSLL